MTLPLRLGRFAVLRLLATGGMAEVLLGRLSGPKGFERLVVIKRILPHLAREAAFVTMFVDEARLVARIRHPNVAQVYELGSDGGELFLVLEYLEGEAVSSIQRALARRKERLDPALVAHVAAEACAGLHAAHELTRDDGTSLGLVHRDVSPQNLFGCFDGRIKVLDFGIAKSADGSFRTRTGEIKGKHAYMSPEQCRGEPLDRRTDVFALGIVLHELLTGRRLFKRASELLTMQAIIQEAAPLPSAVEPSVPASLDRIAARALAIAPDDRYPTALAMRADLLAAAAALRPGVDLSARLAEEMGRLFDAEIAERRELLVAARSEALEEPTAAPTRVEVAAGAATPPGRARSGRAIGLAALLAAIGGGVALAATARSPAVGANQAQVSPPPTSSIAAMTPTPTASAASDAAAPAASVTVRIETIPPGAAVAIGGEARGLTPLSLDLPRGADEVAVELSRAGFATVTERLVPDRDQRIARTLLSVGRSTPRPAAPPTATATAAVAAPPGSARGFRPFE